MLGSTDDTHITEAMAVSYAAGFCGAGVELAIAAHLTYCPACRALVAKREALFGALMAAEEAHATPPACLLARLDEAPEDAPAPAAAPSGPLPRVVADRLDAPFEDIPWRFVLPGVSEHVISEDDDETVSLMRVRPGAAIPRHTHQGAEITVIFDGVLEDRRQDGREAETRAYLPGDFIFADGGVDHRPSAGGDRPCICLAVLTGGLKFTGLFGRALNLFS